MCLINCHFIHSMWPHKMCLLFPAKQIGSANGPFCWGKSLCRSFCFSPASSRLSPCCCQPSCMAQVPKTTWRWWCSRCSWAGSTCCTTLGAFSALGSTASWYRRSVLRKNLAWEAFGCEELIEVLQLLSINGIEILTMEVKKLQEEMRSVSSRKYSCGKPLVCHLWV